MKSFKFRKKGTAFLLSSAGAISFIYLGIRLIAERYDNGYPELALYMGIINILFWLFILTYSAIKFLRNPNGLELDELGMYNFTERFSEGYTNWESIEKIVALKGKFKTKVGFETNNPPKNKWIKQQRKNNLKVFGYSQIMHLDKLKNTQENIYKRLLELKNKNHDESHLS